MGEYEDGPSSGPHQTVAQVGLLVPCYTGRNVSLFFPFPSSVYSVTELLYFLSHSFIFNNAVLTLPRSGLTSTIFSLVIRSDHLEFFCFPLATIRF